MTSSLAFAARVTLTLVFLVAGLSKLTGTLGSVALYDAIGFGQWMRFVTGSIETGGALLLWVPGATAVAAAALALTMVAATGAQIAFVGQPPWPFVGLAILSAFVAWTFSRPPGRQRDGGRGDARQGQRRTGGP